MADSIDRARRTVREINAREAYGQQAEEDERAAELGRWDDDHQVDTATLADDDGRSCREMSSPPTRLGGRRVRSPSGG